MRLVLFLILLLPIQAMAEVNVDLAQERVEITTGFTGATVTLYGVRKQEGEIAVTLSGPKRTMTVRRKGNILGAWINRENYEFKDVPAFYDYALTPAFPEDLARENNITVWPARFPTAEAENEEELLKVQQALIRNKRAEGLFPEGPKGVLFIDEQFFKVSFYVPSNVPVGEYTIETFYARSGPTGHSLQAYQPKLIQVEQVGNSAWIKSFSKDNALIYGLFCIFLAVFAGWISHRIRGGA